MRRIRYLLFSILCMACCQGCTPLMSLDFPEFWQCLIGFLLALPWFLT